MKSKKNLLSALLGVFSVLTCLSGALMLKKNVVVNADVSTQVGQVTGDRNVYLADGASDAVVPLSLGESVASEVAINGVVQNIDIEKGTNNLTLKGISTHLKYGENVVEITDSASNTFKFIVYKNVSQGEIAYYDFDVNTWTKNGQYVVPNEIVDDGIDGKTFHAESNSGGGTFFGFYPANNEIGFANFAFKANTEYMFSFDVKVLSGTSADWWCPMRFGDTGDVGYLYDDYSWQVAGVNSLFAQVTVTPNDDGSYRFTSIFKTLANGSNTSLDIPNWGGACNLYFDNICIKPVNPDAVRIACVGDSITEASNTDYSYPEQLQNILGYENYFVFNFGKSASNVLEAGVYPYRVHAATLYNHLKTWEADSIVMQLGTNDGRWDSGVETYGEEAFIDDYVSLLDEFKGIADKVYINISPYAFGNEFGIHADEVNNVITGLQGHIAYENDVDVIDVHSAVKACDRETYFPDYIHGNNAGYGVIAQMVAAGLKGATFVNKYHLAYTLNACKDTTNSLYIQAKAVYDDVNATQTQIDESYENLKELMKKSVTFQYGEESETIEVAHNSYISNVPAVEKTGKIVTWCVEGTNTEWDFATDKVVSDIVLVAVWRNITYSITYETFDGTHTNAGTYTVEDEIVLGEATKPFYTFVGWYTGYNQSTGEYTGKMDKISVGTTGNLQLFAKWQLVQYTVSFNTDGGTSISDQMVEYEAKAEAPANPVKEGYVFDGWYLDPECTQAYDFDASVTDDVCLYAKWAESVQEKTGGCGSSIAVLPVCGILLASLGVVFIKRKSEN